MTSTFCYLITIHNAAHCLQGTLEGVYATKGLGSKVIAVLDGCTDGSEGIVDSVSFAMEQQGNVPIVKLYAPDVHEIKSINIALRYIQEHKLAEYAITVQDDCWLQDPALEPLTLQMFFHHTRLGHLVYRMATNYDADMNLLDLVDNHCSDPSIGHTLAHHQWAIRMAGCKSPSCLPLRMVEQYGLMDEALAPRGYEDLDFSLTLLENDYETGVLATEWRSDYSWGSTRRGKPQPIAEQDNRNKSYVLSKHKGLLTTFKITQEYRQVESL